MCFARSFWRCIRKVVIVVIMFVLGASWGSHAVLLLLAVLWLAVLWL